MGRDRRLPRAPAKTDSGVPWLALLCAATITLVAAVWAARRDDGMDHLVSVVDIGALTAFTLLHASVVGLFAVRRRGGPVIWWRHVPVPLAGAAITVAVIVEAPEAAQVVGAGVVGRGAVGAGGAAQEAGTGRVVTAGDGALSYRAVTLATWL